MSDQQTLTHLMAIRGDLGELKAGQAAMRAALAAHVQEDEKAHDRIRSLELRQATHKGAAAVWMLLLTGAAALIGALSPGFLEWFKAKVGA